MSDSQETRLFSHSGDLGDIIYSLPTIRALGGGTLVLYDHPGRTAHGMTEAKMLRLKPLLMEQPYIHDVLFSPEMVSYGNLNGFRDHYVHGNLSDCHLATYGLPWTQRSFKWLDVPDPIDTYPVVVHRSARYENPNFPWDRVVQQYKGLAGFCGFPEEHWDFCTRYGEIPLIDCPNFLVLAQYIAGARLFIGNQSSPLAVAQALYQNHIHVICPHNSPHACVFQRLNSLIAWDNKIELPSIKWIMTDEF